MTSTDEKPQLQSWGSSSAHSGQFLTPMDNLPPYSLSDPRSQSMQSLFSDTSLKEGQRNLLIIYLHGFMGDESSFQKFPAHVHKVLSAALKDTHKVHTKIYPKYRSRREITVARDNFSSWLTPHESDDTDIVLVGHSMGGILAAEIVLLPPVTPEGATVQKFRHRILGTVNIDVPFLGLHPGIVVSGISSLFRPADPAPVRQYAVSETASHSTVFEQPNPSSEVSQSNASMSNFSQSDISDGLHTPELSDFEDPNYNPAFDNDVQIARRKGWKNTMHFVLKHANSLPRATFNLFQTHFEFGSCLADFQGLKARYQRLRELEDIDEASVVTRLGPGPHTPRVRFINYYTASTGRKKASHLEVPRTPETQAVGSHGSLASTSGISPTTSASPIIISSPTDVMSPVDTEASTVSLSSIRNEDSMNLEKLDSNLPPLPPTPKEPAPFLPDLYQSKDARKIALKDHERSMKAYKRALKDQHSALKDRQKMLSRQSRRQIKQEMKDERKEKRSNAVRQNENPTNTALDRATSNANERSDPEKPRKPKKFCLTPDSVFGFKDDKWERILMEDMDEVGAHCGMFFPSDTYEVLLGGVVEDITQWLEDDATRRQVLESIHEQPAKSG